jgi:hypothetical protein
VLEKILDARLAATPSAAVAALGESCEWSNVPADAPLVDADPDEIDGLYDWASRLYDHFWVDRPSGVATAKVSKVLHLKYPALVPILDSRLLRLYRPAAKAAMLRSSRWAGPGRLLYWEAIRHEFLRSTMVGL